MPYGFEVKETAEDKAECLRALHPERRYVVAPHSWLPGKPNGFWEPGSAMEIFARTWGVLEYVKTDCRKLPEKLLGFVWF